MMAATASSGFPVPVAAPRTGIIDVPLNRRRRITPEAGHALEILGHAIEYLSDEAVHDGRDLSAHCGEVEAIQLLMALNRKVYYACPEIPTFRERMRLWLHPHRS
jgi:hypothetical protein